MPDVVDLRDMDDVDIAALAVRCMDCLSLADKVQVILKSLHSKEEQGELYTWLSDAMDEDEDEEGGA